MRIFSKKPPCHCLYCYSKRIQETDPFGMTMIMIVCDTCGNKRCPHATHHDNECTHSNEYGQHEWKKADGSV